MVYDNTQGKPDFSSGERGFAIHDIGEEMSHQMNEPRYSLFDDDGKGNGNYIAGSSDVYWIRRIAYSLDFVTADEFDYNGIPK